MAEKEYIERQAVIKIITQIICDTKVRHKGRAINRNIKQLPTADVQEVVRCKDCIFGKYDDDLNMILCKRIYNLSDGECVYNDLNDFCSYGAKMDKE